MNAQAAALRIYFTEKNIKSIEVAEKVGVSKGTISNILNGKYAMGKDLAGKLAEVYGFDMQQQVTGKGSLFPSLVTGRVIPLHPSCLSKAGQWI